MLVISFNISFFERYIKIDSMLFSNHYVAENDDMTENFEDLLLIGNLKLNF